MSRAGKQGRDDVNGALACGAGGFIGVHLGERLKRERFWTRSDLRMKPSSLLKTIGPSDGRKGEGNLRGSKLYDLASGIPLAVWFAIGILGSLYQIPQLLYLRRDVLAVGNQLTNILLLSIMIVLLLVRKTPVLTSQGILPRAVGIAGAAAPIIMLVFPRRELPPEMITLSLILIFAGTLTSIVAVCWLGRAFSILPQARAVVTEGPYRIVRHPLYFAEIVVLCGTSMEFELPWSFFLTLVVVALQIARMHFEEKVLMETFPSYRDYMNRTARLIPGLY
jgi:protein-S-isoprenylcysteine O-methyltransferase Ste14